jgi:hypothetical protein
MAKYVEGYYWVIWGPDSKYPEMMVANWDGDCWTTCGTEHMWNTKDFPAKILGLIAEPTSV